MLANEASRLTRTMKVVVSLCAGSLMFVGGIAPPASAANQDQGDGLDNVQIGDITIQDVAIAAVVDVTANVCDVAEAQVVALATQVDQTNKSRTLCRTEEGPVRIRQN